MRRDAQLRGIFWRRGKDSKIQPEYYEYKTGDSPDVLKVLVLSSGRFSRWVFSGERKASTSQY